ncbi:MULTISPECIES: NUDIX domain-containing protein [unclassified Helicobacter]|uniref:NUDIX domain-containing protein n=1 Tax=unclassified Helicobacter TaxID=2593540 RepID=UPI000CF0CF25|nr:MULTISPECIES: NUDIX domain-containing protein [unclassified Helicobacter]
MKYFKKPSIKVDFSTISYGPLKNPSYIQLASMSFKENGKNKKWEIARTSDSVCIVLFDTDRKSFVIVRQFRPAVFYQNQEDGYTYELCAGLVDKDKSLEVIACEEVFEECGYKISPQDLYFIGSFFSSTGVNGNKQFIYFANVNEKCKISTGGGIEDECIEVLYLPLQDSLSFIFDQQIQKTTSLFLGIHWYYCFFKIKESTE